MLLRESETERERMLNERARQLGLRCNCNRTIQGIREHPLLDERVHHTITNCPKEGVGIKLHHEMSNTLKDLANACGIRAQREEVNCFQSILNNVHFTDKEKRYRPDLSLFDMPGSHRKVILDISSTCPIPILGQQQFTFNEARETERAAKSRYSERELKFNEIAKACGCKFQAIILETTGRMHSKSLTFIESIFKKKIWLQRRIPSQILLVNSNLLFLPTSSRETYSR